MADLQLEVPERIEHAFDDALAPGGLLVGKQEEQVDVGAERHGPAPIAADGADGDALGGRRVVGLVVMLHRRDEERLDDRVHDLRQALGRGEARARAGEHVADAVAPGGERGCELCRQRGLELISPLRRQREDHLGGPRDEMIDVEAGALRHVPFRFWRA